ncbi:SEC-C metal-binding domain-containing protein [Aeromonas popoffii]|uniref:SEC-C metal-binding domain-containing protein n=1 Tax=Aeromonas popoffii TaxID=70856 RepID=UPI0005A7AE65|nr:SEC-C metal-binding domain-containing protein [Aeromonas popoffii]
MQNENDKMALAVLDSAQLTRIEAVHRGFLYQHLYAVGCLLLAPKLAIDIVQIELDEDIELVAGGRHIYVQVKTRSNAIIPSDIDGALGRFELIRKEHNEKRRKGEALFVIVANQAPGPKLQKAIDEHQLPPDVFFLSPHSPAEPFLDLPPAWLTLLDAATWCVTEAEKLNFSMLSPESLVWKLAGLVQLAATGSVLNREHLFHANDLPALFEQLIVQLQDFPTPPILYRPQKMEPSLTSEAHVRIICGLSGAGKTAWAAQAAVHCTDLCAYYDVGDLPGPALASTLVRELAAKFASKDRDGLRKILLPGSSGYEALRTFDSFLKQQNVTLLLVLDNAHRIPVENLRNVLNAATNIRFVLLCQPHDNVRELEAVLDLQRETLLGWDIDTVAAAVDELGGFGTALGYEQLRAYTGGLPLYIQSASKIAVSGYHGDIDALCAELQQQENSVETAQEVILTRVYRALDELVQDSLALFSLADVGLSREEVSELLVKSLNVSKSAAAILIKKMRVTGNIEIFGNQTMKVHDAIRALGLQHLELMNPQVTNNALLALRDLLITSLHETRDTSRFSLLTQVFIRLNDAMALISLSGEELFHEMGITVDIMASLENALKSDALDPVHKFWALDGIIFSEFRQGNFDKAYQRFEAMEVLLAENELGHSEEIAYVMKKILFLADVGNANEVEQLVKDFRYKLPDTDHKRIFDYNYAIALWKLKKHKDAEVLCQEIIGDYYRIIGINPDDVIGKNADVLWEIINKTENVQEHIKHLADALELYARTLDAQRKISPFARIHSMKFYNMVQAADSMVRVGQDLADDFVAREDYVGAREVMEQHVLPVVHREGLVNRLIQVRSQYAVILALCGQHDEAGAEMQLLAPYIEGLTGDQRTEIENQSKYIARLAYQARLATPTRPITQKPKSAVIGLFGRIGRNEQCPCGSGLKFKRCHGV